MTVAEVALRQAGLVRVMASYQDGIPLALTRLSYFGKRQVTIEPGGGNWGFSFTVEGSSTAHSGSELYLHVVDKRFPWHWAMRVGDDEACLAWGEFYKAELKALDASNESSATCAVRYGRPIVLKWLLDQGFPVRAKAMQAAVKHNDLAMFQQLCAVAPQSIPSAVVFAMLNGRLDLLQYLYAAFPAAVQAVGHSPSMTRMASVPMLRFLYDSVGARPSQSNLLLAAYSRNADILDAILSMLDPADASTMVQRELQTRQPSPAMRFLFDRSRRFGLNVVYRGGPATADASISHPAIQPAPTDHLRPDSAEMIARLDDDRNRWNNVPGPRP